MNDYFLDILAAGALGYLRYDIFGVWRLGRFSIRSARRQTDYCGNRKDLGAWMAKHALSDEVLRHYNVGRMNGGLFCIM